MCVWFTYEISKEKTVADKVQITNISWFIGSVSKILIQWDFVLGGRFINKISQWVKFQLTQITYLDMLLPFNITMVDLGRKGKKNAWNRCLIIGYQIKLFDLNGCKVNEYRELLWSSTFSYQNDNIRHPYSWEPG